MFLLLIIDIMSYGNKFINYSRQRYTYIVLYKYGIRRAQHKIKCNSKYNYISKYCN